MYRALAIVFCGLLSSAEAEVIGEHAWEFEKDQDGCYVGVLSHSEDSRFQLVVEDDKVSGFLITKIQYLDGLAVEEEIPAYGVFDDDDIIELGKLSLVGRKPFEVGSQEPWAYLMFTEPNRTGDRRMLINETLTIYTLPNSDYPEGLPLGTFSLTGAGKALTSLAECAQQKKSPTAGKP